MFCLFWVAAFTLVGHGLGKTHCEEASFSQSLPVVSLCYNEKASAKRVALDGYLTYYSTTFLCECTLTSTHSANVSFSAHNNLQPSFKGCGSNLTVRYGGRSFTINCFVLGTATVFPLQPVTLAFDKPSASEYNSDYCMLLTPGAEDKFPTRNTPSATSLKTAITTFTTKLPKTTSRSTTLTLLTHRATTRASTSRSPKTSETVATFSFSATTTGTTTATISNKTTTISPHTWRYTILAVGAGFVLTIVIHAVLAVWCNRRRVNKSQGGTRDNIIESDNQINLPYSPYSGQEPNRTSNLSMATDVYDKIDIVDNAKNNANEGKFASHSQPLRHDVLMNISVYESYLTPDEIAVEMKQTKVADRMEPSL